MARDDLENLGVDWRTILKLTEIRLVAVDWIRVVQGKCTSCVVSL
jgi:hypothetical protein